LKGFVLEISKNRYDLLPVHGDDPEAIKGEVEAILRRFAES